MTMKKRKRWRKARCFDNALNCGIPVYDNNRLHLPLAVDLANQLVQWTNAEIHKYHLSANILQYYTW